MSTSKEKRDDEDIVVDTHFSSDTELIVLDSVDSSSNGSSVEEIVQCNNNNIINNSPVVFLSEGKCALNREEDMNSQLRDENGKLNEEVKKLKIENRRLREQLPDLPTDSDTNPQVQVIFGSKRMERKYRHRVRKFLRRLLSKEANGPVHVSIRNEESESTLEPNAQPADIFCMDNIPSAELEYIENYIPSYESNFEKPMQKTPEVIVANKKSKTPTCFNCQGDHVLAKCPEPWNHQRINENRQNLFRSTVKSPRYHVEKQRSDKYRPGEISEELRSALHLKSDQIPSYVYRMRTLGYPPGWMKEAQIESSGITIYDSDGKAIVEENVEEGEVDSSSIRVQYDPKKLVSYPGFNVSLPPGIIDESAKMGVPPMQYCHLRTEFEKSMKPPEANAYRKRKLPPLSSEKKRAKLDIMNRIEDDMEIEFCSDGTILNASDEDAKKCVFVPPLPPDNPAKPPPPPTSSKKSAGNSQSSADTVDGRGRISPSLTDLEYAKHKLILELDQVSDGSDSISSPVVAFQKPNDSPLAKNDSLLSSDSEDKSSDRNASLSVNPGTPVHLKHSQFTRLPDTEKFSQGIAEHLCFENLPDSTGQYERMRQLVSKIKEFQK